MILGKRHGGTQRKFPQEYAVTRKFNDSQKTLRRYTNFLEKEIKKKNLPALRALKKFPQEYVVTGKFNDSPKTPRGTQTFWRRKFYSQTNFLRAARAKKISTRIYGK